MPNIETKNFIATNLFTDLNKLLLAKKTNSAINYDFAIRQIDGLQRIRTKIPSFYSNENIIFPPKLNLEQCSSESTALYKKSLCEGNLFIDITGGFGVDFYFMSRNFKHAIYVERNKSLIEIVEQNFKALCCSNISIINSDANEFIESMPESDCIFVDPARRDSTGGKVVFLSHCEPDLINIYSKLLAKTQLLIVKLSPMLDITAAIQSLNYVSEVHVVSVANECKEILLVLRPNFSGSINYFAINILKNNEIDRYSFTKTKEENAVIEFTSLVQKYLYEPNSSVLKAGAFKSIAKDFGIYKLHKNTHLYTSDTFCENFPGRVFEVINVWNTGKKDLSELKKKSGKANLSTRNYPLTTEQLKKKIGIADGGDTYLFGCTLNDESKILIECRKTISAI